MQFEDLLAIFKDLKGDRNSAWNSRVKNHINNLAIVENAGELFVAPINYVTHFIKNKSREKGSVDKGSQFNEIIECLKEQGYSKVTRSENEASTEFQAYEDYYRSLPTKDYSNFKTRNSKLMTFWITENPHPIIAPKDLTKKHILKAMERFKNGERPDSFKKPRGWHVIHLITQEAFPLKGVYGLATGLSCSHKKFNSFKTNEAYKKLTQLGFDCVDITKDAIGEELQQGVERSYNNISDVRQERLRSAPRKPVKTMQMVVRFQRNPDVIAERLHMAQGKCEACFQPAPFRKKKDNEPFLEVHHVIPLADGGEDTVENTRALCPNCHRQAHFG